MVTTSTTWSLTTDGGMEYRHINDMLVTLSRFRLVFTHPYLLTYFL